MKALPLEWRDIRVAYRSRLGPLISGFLIKEIGCFGTLSYVLLVFDQTHDVGRAIYIQISILPLYFSTRLAGQIINY